jgi:hypothetical protein
MKKDIFTLFFKLLFFTVLFININPCFAQPHLKWVEQIGGASGSGFTRDVAVDSNKNVYSTGNFSGTCDFDPGPGIYTLSALAGSAFIQKLDSNKNFIWAKQIQWNIPGTLVDAHSLVLDNKNNIYITGTFSNTVDFDPGPGIYNMTSNSSGHDIFVEKLDSNGNFNWAKHMGGIGYNQGFSIKVDANYNVYTTGYFSGTCDFDPGPGIFNIASAGQGSHEIYIQKLDSAGNFIWAKEMEGSYDWGQSLSLDAFGHIYITGYFMGTTDFDPGIGIYILTSNGSQDIFIEKLDTAGSFIWVRQIGSTDYDQGTGITIDASGNIYTTGYFSDTVDFDPGTSIYNLSSAGSNNIFVLKLDSSGNFSWARQMSGPSANSMASFISLDLSANIYVTGIFRGTVDFDPGIGIDTLTSSPASKMDIFIFKLNSIGDYVWARRFGSINDDVGSCIVIDNENNIYTTGYFKNTVDFDPDSGIYNLSASNNSNGFVLKMNQCANSSSSQTEKACIQYLWNGVTYTATGIYADTIANAIGCDSLMTLNLVVWQLSDSVSNNGPTLTAFQTGSTYQWVDCDNGYAAIVGATNQSYTPISSGHYAVIITENTNGCIDTSDCKSVYTIGFDEIQNENIIQVVPNPSGGKFAITTNSLESLSYKIIDATGKIILQKENQNGSTFLIDISDKSNGIYFLDIGLNNTHHKIKIVKD